MHSPPASTSESGPFPLIPGIPLENVQYETVRGTLRFKSPAISLLRRQRKGYKLIIKQVMPLRPSGDDWYTARGPNPHFVRTCRPCDWFGVAPEPREVEVVRYTLEDAQFASPVIDFSRNLVGIDHVDGYQFYRVLVLREGIIATATLLPIETPSVCCILRLFPFWAPTRTTEYDIHYRHSDWYTADGQVVHALGFTKDGKKYAALQVAPYVSCDIPYSDFVGIDLRNGSKYSVTSVEHNLSIYKTRDPLRTAPLVAKSIMTHIRLTDFPADGTSMLEGGQGEGTVHHLDDEVPQNDDAEGPPVKVIPNIIKTDVGVTDKTVTAVKIAEQERIAPHLNNVQPPEDICKMRDWFINQLIPEKYRHTGVPLSLEEALSEDRPSQAAKFEAVCNDAIQVEAEKIKIFLKTEVIDPASAPRVVSNPGDHERVFNRTLGQPLAEFLKTLSFLKRNYAFVAPPELQILIERVASQVANGDYKWWSETDFSKMDATVNEWCRDFEFRIGRLFFRRDLHDLWKQWHRKLYKEPRSKKLCGHSVNMGSSRRSGEYFTSLFNTILAAFFAFATFARMGLSYDEALLRVGVVGGDDGLHSGMDETIAEETAALIGFKVKVKSIPLGKPACVLGLLRFGDGTYTHEPKRFVTKSSSIATGRSVPPEEAAYRKFDMYARLYPNIPIVGTMSKAVIRILRSNGFTGPNARYDALCRNVAGYTTKVFYDLGNGTPFPCNSDKDELRGMMAVYLGIERTVLDRLEDAFENARSFSDFPSHVLDAEVKDFLYPTALNGNIYGRDRHDRKLVKSTSTSRDRPNNGKTKSRQAPKPEEDSDTSSRHESIGSTSTEPPPIYVGEFLCGPQTSL
jgi:hypothetical protein